jgi:hypothetical protein
MEEPTTSNFMVKKKGVVTTKKTALFTDTAVRTSNITQRLRIPQISLSTEDSFWSHIF